jgi:thiamine pyrophosphate-dependent acetolactate synthase large subunit-like protein
MSERKAMRLLDRREAVEALLAGRGNMLVVTGLGSSTYDVFASGDHHGNFYLWGAMGGAALVGLGLAIAQPTRPVIVVTGDGEQLMGLGGLATIAVREAPNLSIVVLDNGHYGETGGQVSHSGLGVDLGSVARSVGIANVQTVDTKDGLAHARSAIGAITNGPRFVTIRISNEEKARALPARDGAFLKSRLRAYIGHPVC